MGAVTPAKKQYDDLTVDNFKKDGWYACSVTGTGWFADVLAVKDRSLAIIEVKSSKESATGLAIATFRYPALNSTAGGCGVP